MHITTLIRQQIDFIHEFDRCHECKRIFRGDHIDPQYEGNLATYDNDQYCDMECAYSYQHANKDKD